MKRNLSLIKRLRSNVNKFTQKSLVTEIWSLSLNKFVTEIIKATFIMLCKIKLPEDLESAVEVVSALHQRLGVEDYTVHLAWFVSRAVLNPHSTEIQGFVRELGDKESISYQRRCNLVYVATELWLVGIFIGKVDCKGYPSSVSIGFSTSNEEPSYKLFEKGHKLTSCERQTLPLLIVESLLGSDPLFTNISLISYFIRLYSSEIIAQCNNQEKGLSCHNNKCAVREEHNSRRATISRLIPGYKFTFLAIGLMMQNYHWNLCNFIMSKLVTELLDGRVENFLNDEENDGKKPIANDSFAKELQKYIAFEDMLADTVYKLRSFPQYAPQKALKRRLDVNTKICSEKKILHQLINGGDDEDQHLRESFSHHHGISSSTKIEKKNENTNILGSVPIDYNIFRDSPKTSEQHISDSNMYQNSPSNIDADMHYEKAIRFIEDLPNIIGPFNIDRLSYSIYQSKEELGHDRIMQILLDMSNKNCESIHLYARMVGIFTQEIPGIIECINVHLLKTYMKSVTGDQSKSLMVKDKINARYLAELTKLDLFPLSIFLWLLQTAFARFSHNDIDLIYIMLETCGTYLQRNRQTDSIYNDLVQTFQQKQRRQFSRPEDRKKMEVILSYLGVAPYNHNRQLPDLCFERMFLDHIVMKKLQRKTLYKIARYLRKFDWKRVSNNLHVKIL